MTHTILGLSHDGNHVELHGETRLEGAKQWVALYTKHGNWGGYYGLAVVAPDGTWVAEYTAPETEE